jgi:adenylate cyclase
MRISLIGLKFSIVVIFMISTVIVLMGKLTIDRVRDSLINEMYIRANFFARTVKESLFPHVDLFNIHFAVSEVKREKAVLYAIIHDKDGKVISDSEGKLIGVFDESSAGKRAVHSKESAPFLQEYFRDGEHIYEIVVPLVIGVRRIGTARLGFSDSSIKKAISELQQQILLIGVMLVSGGILLTLLVITFMVRPINTLTRAALEVGKGNLDIKVELRRRDEIGVLARAFNEMVSGLKERDIIFKTFGKYVSETVAKSALQGKIKLGGERRIVTVLVVDIRDFTALSEKLLPEEVVSFLNKYYGMLVDVVFGYNGTVDKFIGDALFAVFGAPMSLPDHPLRAVKAAWEIKRSVGEFNEARKKQNLFTIKIGMAIHTGIVVAGNIGSERRLEYTCIGDTVNTCHRIEALNKEWGTEILMSATTYYTVRNNVEARPMPLVKLRGKTQEIQLYELLGIKS